MARPTSVILGVAGDFSAFNAGLQRAIQSAQKTMSGVKFTSPLGTISNDARDFEKSLQAASQRVIAFSASLGSLAAVATIFKTIIKDTVAIEQAFVDINSVFQLSTSNLQKFSKELFDVARQTSQGFDVAAEAAKEFSRQGLDATETLKRVRDSLILTRASGLDINKSVETLTATINSFNSASVDSTKIINKLVAVDQSFAVSARDLAEALSRVGSTAQDAGVSFDELIGLVTAAQQTTARGGSVIGNSLKTIFTRIGRADTLQQLEDLNIEVKDLQGNALPAISVMSNLAKEFDRLSESAKAQAAELVGGVFQINVLRSVLKDLGKEQGIAAQATRVSTAAFDEAIKRNDALNKSLQSLLTQTQLTAKEIGATIGQITFSDKLKEAIGIINNNPIVDSFKNINTADTGLKYGENVGGNIAEGILSGIGNVLTGPALFYTIKILSGVAAQTFKTFGADILQLAGINKESSRQEALARQINSLYESGATSLQRQLATTRAISAEMARMTGATVSPAPSTRYSTSGPTPSAPYTSFAPYIFASSQSASASAVAPAGMINKIIRGTKTTPFDRTFSETVQREISESGRNLSEALNYAYAEFSRIGITTSDLSAAMVRTIKGLDQYETTLRTNQDIALRTRGIQRGERILSNGGTISAGSGLFNQFIHQSDISTETSYRQSIGKTASDVLSPREQAILNRLQRRNAYSTGNRISSGPMQGPPQVDPFIALSEGSRGFFSGLSAPRLAEEIISQRGLSGTGANSIREAALLRRAQASRNGQFAASFALPFAAGFLPEGAGGTGTGQALATTGGALQGAGIGFAFGPQGAIGGAIIGAGVGFVGKLRQSFEELAKQIEEGNTKNIELLNQTTNYNRISESLRGAAAGGASPRDLSILSAQQRDVFSSITDPKIRRQLLAAGGNANEEQDVFLRLSREVGLQSSARDVATAIKSSNDTRGILGKFFGGDASNKSFGELTNAIQIALQKGIDANGPDFKTKAQEAFKSDPKAGLKLLGVSELEFPQLFKELDVATKDLKFAFDFAANNMIDFANETIIAKEKQANFSRQINNIIQSMTYEAKYTQNKLNSNAEINKLITNASIDILGGNSENISERKSVSQLQSIRAIGAAQLAGSIGSTKANLLQLGSDKGQSNAFLSATLEANSEEMFSQLEKLAENSDVKKAIREAVFELRSIKDNTRLEIEKTSALIEVTRIQSEIESRSRLLSNGRYDENTIQRFFDSRLAGKSGLGATPIESRANALLQRSDLLTSLGIGDTNDSKNIRDTLSILSTTGTIAKIVSDITGEKLDSSDISGIRAAAQRGIDTRSGKNLTEISEIDNLNRAMDALSRTQISQESLVARLMQSQTKGLGTGVLLKNPLGTNSSASLGAEINLARASFDNRKGNAGNRFDNIIDSQQEILRQQAFKDVGISALNTRRNSFVKLGQSDRFDENLSGFLSKSLEEVLPGEVLPGDYGYQENPVKNTIVKEILDSIKAGNTSEMIKSTTSANGNIFNLVKNNTDIDPRQISALMESLINVAAQQFAIDLLLKGYEDAKTNKNVSSTLPSTLRPNFQSKTFPQLNDFYSKSFTQSLGINPSAPSLTLPGQKTFTSDIGPTNNEVRTLLESLSKKDEKARISYKDAVLKGNVDEELAARKEMRDIARETLYLSGLLTSSTQKQLFISKQIAEAWDRVAEDYDAIASGKLISGSKLEADIFDAAKTEGLSGNYLGSLKDGFQSPFARMKQDMRDFSEVGASVANSLEKNFSDAFSNFAIGASKGRDAFRSFAVSVLQDASRAFASKAVQGLLGMILAPSAGIASTTPPQPQATGGIMSKAPALLTDGEVVIPRKDAANIGYDVLSKFNSGSIAHHAFGGVVKGGSGVRDDVFKMLDPGDFVVKKSSVQKYGAENLLEMVKHGRVQKKFLGGMLLGGLLGGAIGYASGGKKGALIGALGGGLAGGLFQNYAQTGNAFQGLSNGSMFSFSGSSALKPNPLLTQFLAAGALGLAAGALTPKQKSESDTLPTLSFGQTENLRKNIEMQEAQNLSKKGPGYLVPVEKDGFIVYERAMVPATRRYSQGGIASSSSSSISLASLNIDANSLMRNEENYSSEQSVPRPFSPMLKPTLAQSPIFNSVSTRPLYSMKSEQMDSPVLNMRSNEGVPSLLSSDEIVVPREVVQSAGLRTFTSGGVAGSPSINMNPTTSDAATWNGDINITINKDGSMTENNNAQKNDDSKVDNLANNIRGAVMDVLNQETRAGGILYSAYGTSRMSR